MKTSQFLGLVNIFILFKTVSAADNDTYVSTINQTILGNECILRKSGACKVININSDYQSFVELKDMGVDLPSELFVKLNIEIDYMDNKYNFGVTDIRKNKTDYDFNVAKVVDILFTKTKSPGKYYYRLVLGEKYNHLAFLEVSSDMGIKTVYCNFSPELPVWPYTVHISISKNGSISISETGQTEPFLYYEGPPVDIHFMTMRSRSDKAIKLIGFYDCSVENQGHCGKLIRQSINGCREHHLATSGLSYRHFLNIESFVVKSDPHLILHESFAAIPGKETMQILLSETSHEAISENFLQVKMSYLSQNKLFKKHVRTEKLNEFTSSKYFLQLAITKENITVTKYSQEKAAHQTLISLRACDYFANHSVKYMAIATEHFEQSSFYFDCCKLEETNCTRLIKNTDFHQSTNEAFGYNMTFNNFGYNLTKLSLDTFRFVDNVTSEWLYYYYDDYGTRSIDWCPTDLTNLTTTNGTINLSSTQSADEYADDETGEKVAEEKRYGIKLSDNTIRFLNSLVG